MTERYNVSFPDEKPWYEGVQGVRYLGQAALGKPRTIKPGIRTRSVD